MLLNYDYLQTLLLVTTYMLIYNLTSFVLFTTCLQLSNVSFRTLFSFSNLGLSNIFTKILCLTLLSLAGVPPLAGFFSKTFLLVLLAHSYFFLLFPPFFALLFTGLYFYIQNLRFLNSSSAPLASSPVELGAKNSSFYFYLALPILFFTVFGCFFIEDLLLFVSWLLL